MDNVEYLVKVYDFVLYLELYIKLSGFCEMFVEKVLIFFQFFEYIYVIEQQV